MTARAVYQRAMRVSDCYAVYRGYAKYFGYIGNGQLVCIVSRRSIPSTITEIEYQRQERRPLYQIEVDVRMGKGYIPSTQSNHRNRIVSASPASIKPTAQVLVFMYGR